MMIMITHSARVGGLPGKAGPGGAAAALPLHRGGPVVIIVIIIIIIVISIMFGIL